MAIVPEPPLCSPSILSWLKRAHLLSQNEPQHKHDANLRANAETTGKCEEPKYNGLLHPTILNDTILLVQLFLLV